VAIINGTSGNDSLVGTADSDTINGLGGNDTFGPSGGSDFYDGGAGFDTIDYRVSASGVHADFATGAIFVGGVGETFAGIERFLGGSGHDGLLGAAGGQNLSGQAGMDTLYGGAGNDTLWGGTQADTFIFRESGAANADRLGDFASGSDSLVLDDRGFGELGVSGNFVAGDVRFAANSTGTAQDSSDRLIFQTTTGQVWYDPDGTGAAARQLIATLQAGATLAATDIEVVNGGGTGEAITGTEGNDTLNGTVANELIEGLGGNDLIGGGGGNDTLDGGMGDDAIFGTGLLLGGDGHDFLEVDRGVSFTGETTVRGGAGDDQLWGYGELYGEEGSDWLYAEFGEVLLDGGAGDDLFLDFSLNDSVDGGEGVDHVRAYDQDHDALIINLAAGTMTDRTGAFSAPILNVEHVTRLQQGSFEFDDHGYRFDDYLIGSDADNRLDGSAGSDTLDGGLGNDTLMAYPFGESPEVFTFSAAPGAANADVITRFESGQASLQLELAAHTQLGARGNFVEGDARFWSSSAGTAHDASDRVIYNTSTGELWYDSDGTAAGAAQLIATLEGWLVDVPTLSATDIAVVDSRSSPSGTAGDDWMAGRDGFVNDSFSGGLGNDRFDGREGNDTLNGGDGNDTLDGGDGADLVLGGAGNDVLRTVSEIPDGVGTGPDTLNGGTDDDTYEIVMLSDEDLGHAMQLNFVLQDSAGTDTVVTNQSWTLGDGMENLTLQQAPEDFFVTGTGNAANNLIRADASGLGYIFQMDGADGNDTLIGEDGEDSFFFNAGSGSYGSDLVDGGGGAFDELNFTGGRSAVVVDMRAGTVSGGGNGGSGSVTFANIEWIRGSAFADHVTGHDGGIGVRAHGGNDTVLGGTGNDFLSGEDGADSLAGGAGNDSLVGGAGADTLLFAVAPSSANADSIQNFVSGEDKIQLDGAAHADLGSGGNFAAGDARFWSSSTGTAHDADDRVVYNTANGQLWYDADGNGAGVAQLIGTLTNFSSTAPALAATDIAVVNGSTPPGNVINGTSGNDTLSGTEANDTINGLGGNDLFLAGSSGGADVIDGGAGSDSIEFKARATSPVVVDFGSGTITGGSSGSISFTSIERVVTGNFNDSLTGNAAAQNLTGQNGSDTLAGAGGFDTLWGGVGADTFVFREMGTANADRIGDWVSGSDEMHLDDAAFAAIGAMGDFVSGDARFKANSSGTATDASDRLVFNTSTGQLYYDADGNGGGTAQLIATVQGGASVAATDIVVI
jgi:Ca2+-binding RTX toxin-like protein